MCVVAVVARAMNGPPACSAPAPCLPLVQNSRCCCVSSLCSQLHPLAVIQMLARCSHTDVRMCTRDLPSRLGKVHTHRCRHVHTSPDSCLSQAPPALPAPEQTPAASAPQDSGCKVVPGPPTGCARHPRPVLPREPPPTPARSQSISPIDWPLQLSSRRCAPAGGKHL